MSVRGRPGYDWQRSSWPIAPCRLLTYWPARSRISGAGPEFRRNSKRAISPVKSHFPFDGQSHFTLVVLSSPNQVLTHAARAAPLVAARGAREGLWLEQVLSTSVCFFVRTNVCPVLSQETAQNGLFCFPGKLQDSLIDPPIMNNDTKNGKLQIAFAGLRGSSLRFPPITTKPGDPKQNYPTCCPLVRFSHIGSIEDAARDGPCAHGNKQNCLKITTHYIA